MLKSSKKVVVGTTVLAAFAALFIGRLIASSRKGDEDPFYLALG